jgi:UDP-glucose:(heptosyl)LPS alpha-1,3-glucosyltransferase
MSAALRHVSSDAAARSDSVQVKIAFVVHDYHRAGGHSRYVAELANRFSRTHEVHVFANTIEPDAAEIHFHHVPAWRLNALTTIFTFILPATRLLDGGFDIVHAQGLCSLNYDVLTAHICNRAWYQARRETRTAVGWKERVVDRLFDSLVSPVEKWLYRSSTAAPVIAISEVTRRNLSKFYRREAGVSVIHHGVDGSLFKPANRRLYRTEVRAQLGLAESEFVFLFVGNLRKGALFAIQALQHLKEGKLLLVSPTPPNDYERAVGQLGLKGRVIFCSPTETIERYYAAADAFVFPSPYEDFGMVISEAMASGLPVITGREAGAAELIEHGREGFLLENPADAEEIAGYLRRLMTEPELGRAFGLAAREKTESYTWDAVAERTMDVYRQVLAARR